jgi:anti-sigma factor RsiW
MTTPPTTDAMLTEPRMLDCEQTVRMLWDYLDQELSALDVRAVDRHLHECKAKCASHFAFERAFLKVMHSSRPRTLASDALRARVRALIDAERANAAAGGEDA